MFSWDTSIKIILEMFNYSYIKNITNTNSHLSHRACSGFQENQGNSIIYVNHWLIENSKIFWYLI